MPSTIQRNDERIDQLEAVMLSNMPAIDCPIVDRFAKGMYIREMTAYKDSLITSKIHKTQHPFTLSKGKLLVRDDDGEWFELSAPFTGITQPGTRRVAIVLEDCIWTTYHTYRTITGEENNLSELEQQKIISKIEKRIIKKHDNKLLKMVKEKQLWHG